MENKILQGDALTKLKELPEKSVNMCMTSPPYWALRDYGDATSGTIWGGDERCEHDWKDHIKKPRGGRGSKGANVGANQNDFANMRDHDIVTNFCKKCGAWKGQLGLEPTFDQYISNLCDIFDGVKRVLKDDSTCWVNLGDTYYGSGKGAGGDQSKCKESYTMPTDWKRPSRDEFTKAGIKKNCLICNKEFLGKENSQFCSRECLNKKGNDFRSQNRQLPDKCLTMIPMRFAIEMVNRGWILRNTIIWHKPNCMPCSVKDRFTVDFEYIFLFSKKKKYYFEQQIEKYQSKPDHSPRDKSSEKYEGTELFSKGGRDYYSQGGRNKRTTWSICPKPFKEAHFAVYPEELCETPIKAGCPEGGMVLDPFFGAGTTGLVALKQNKNFIGIELNPEYIEIAEKRLKPFKEQTTLNLNNTMEDKDDD